MSRLFAPLTSKHRREKQAKQRSLASGSKDPVPISKSSSFPNDVKENTSITANSPYYHATTNSRPTTPAPITENTNVPVSHPLTPPQSPRAEQAPDTAPPVKNPELAEDIALTEDAPAASNASRSSSPVPRPVLEAIQQPLVVVKEATAREDDLVVPESNPELDHLSTEELRKQWEDQEIERFLRVFSRVCFCLLRSVLDINVYFVNSKSTKCVAPRTFLPPRVKLKLWPTWTCRWSLLEMNLRKLTP
jgi:hypothetical protein